MGAALVEQANAKINLTLRVIGRRADGFHELESLVAFADLSDVLALEPGAVASLDVSGPFADAAGAQADNLVLKAARALGVPGGHFKLTKNIPVAAGLGGGSADAAAALRALATANNIPSARVMEAACRVGADVPVCLDPRPRVMQGIGEVLSPPVTMPKLAAVLVNPGVAAATKDVFAKLDLSKCGKMPLEDIPSDRMAFVAMLAKRTNDLTLPALAVAPVIADVLSGLSKSAGNLLARMSGSGATCFGIYASSAEAEAAARQLSAAQPKWWVRATAIGDPLS